MSRYPVTCSAASAQHMIEDTSSVLSLTFVQLVSHAEDTEELHFVNQIQTSRSNRLVVGLRIQSGHYC